MVRDFIRTTLYSIAFVYRAFFWCVVQDRQQRWELPTHKAHQCNHRLMLHCP